MDSDRHVTSVIFEESIKQYRPSKHYVHQLRVTSSNREERTVYRKYSHFYDFHIDLIDLFPEEAGEYSGPRILPYLPGRKLFRGEVRKVAEERKLHLHEYCRILLSLPAKISRHEHVTSFFDATVDDLTPPTEEEKTSRWYLPNIILSKVTSALGKNKTVKLDSKPLGGPAADNLAQEEPFTTYIVVADYQAAARGEISLATGQEVEVVEKAETGWWFVVAAGEEGWAPASFLDLLARDQANAEDQEPSMLEKVQKFIVLRDYVAQLDDELSLIAGATVHVFHKLLDGWWVVSCNGKVGYAPATLLESAEQHQAIETNHLKPKRIRNPTQRRCTVKRPLGAQSRTTVNRDLSEYRKLQDRINLRLSNNSELWGESENIYEIPFCDLQDDNSTTDVAARNDRAAKTKEHAYVNTVIKDVPSTIRHCELDRQVIVELNNGPDREGRDVKVYNVAPKPPRLKAQTLEPGDKGRKDTGDQLKKEWTLPITSVEMSNAVPKPPRQPDIKAKREKLQPGVEATSHDRGNVSVLTNGACSNDTKTVNAKGAKETEKPSALNFKCDKMNCANTKSRPEVNVRGKSPVVKGEVNKTELNSKGVKQGGGYERDFRKLDCHRDGEFEKLSDGRNTKLGASSGSKSVEDLSEGVVARTRRMFEC